MKECANNLYAKFCKDVKEDNQEEEKIQNGETSIIVKEQELKLFTQKFARDKLEY